MRRWLWLAAVLSIIAFRTASAEPLQSPPEQAVFRGAVLDPSHLPIVGARVTAVAEGKGSGLSTLTNELGEFTLVLGPGSYTLRIAADGFLEIEQTLGARRAGSEPREFVLRVAGVQETVNVGASVGYHVSASTSATKTSTLLRDVPQAITVVTRELIKDQLMTSIGDVVRYVPGISAHQGENNRDDVVIRGNRSSADFFLNGVRDDVQYYRDLYNLDRVEALKGPNAMIFGRGGGGGVVNRVIKEAGFQPLRAFTLQGGGYDNKRVTADVGQPLSHTAAFRLNGMFERSGSFRPRVDLERAGLNPTLTYVPGSRTRIVLGYEYLRDTRVADRGLTSVRGKPAAVPASTFYGNPDDSQVRSRVNLGSASVEHRAERVIIRSRTLVGGYARFYQNFVPGTVTPDQSRVILTAYNNATNRTNAFNQTDLTYVASTLRVRHTLLVGGEVGQQLTDNFRATGFFNDVATAIQVPFDTPTINVPVTFRQNATDADNHVRTRVAAAFAQDQVELSRYVHVVGGLRFDRFDLQYHNNRNGDTLDRVDHLVSPRAGLVLKPITPLSIYGSYSVSYLPGSGDQFSSLTTITEQVEPEKFNNYEAGVKWDLSAALSLTTAVYRLDRTNTRSTDPNDPTRIVQTGSQRTNGYELGLNGQVSAAWTIAGGYAWQDALVTSATTTAPTGARVGQVPDHTFSLWNRYQLHSRFSAALGVIHRSDMFAAIDNTVTLPGYTRADTAVYLSVSKNLRLQANVENLFDEKYFVNADSNTNISPGFPRIIRLGLTAVF